MKAKATLKQIAKELNVSVSTVSKALNDSPEISEQTKTKIKEYAKLKNYKPNVIGLNLKNRKTKTIGVIIPNILNSFFAKVFSGIEKVADAKGYNVIMCISNESLEKEAHTLEMLSNGTIDGFILSVSEEAQKQNNYDHFKEIINDGTPIVMFDRIADGIDCDKVIVDDFDAIAVLVVDIDDVPDRVPSDELVTLGDDEARRRGSQKTVLERKAPPTFEIAVEMLERQRWVVHECVADTVDTLLRGRQPTPQTRTVDDNGKVGVVRQLAVVNGGNSNGNGNGHITNVEESFLSAQPNGWRSSGQMVALPPLSLERERPTGRSEFDRLLDESFNYSESFDFASRKQAGPNGEDLPLHIYPYGVSRQQLEQVINVLTLPVILTKDLDSADAILALRSHVKNHAKLRQMAKARHVPIHVIKSSTIPQITRSLRRLLNIDDPDIGDDRELQLLLHNGGDDEMDALEEARLAVEQIVIPKGQPVELLPRSSQVRKMQHELVEHYRLKSDSFGDEPNRRLRIYPA